MVTKKESNVLGPFRPDLLTMTVDFDYTCYETRYMLVQWDQDSGSILEYDYAPDCFTRSSCLGTFLDEGKLRGALSWIHARASFRIGGSLPLLGVVESSRGLTMEKIQRVCNAPGIGEWYPAIPASGKYEYSGVGWSFVNSHFRYDWSYWGKFSENNIVSAGRCLYSQAPLASAFGEMSFHICFMLAAVASNYYHHLKGGHHGDLERNS